jgi:flavin-binding protein dodecin
MANVNTGAIKVVEVIGISPKSFDDAVAQAVKKASKTIKGITGIEVVKHSAKVDKGKIVQYKANVKLAFIVK